MSDIDPREDERTKRLIEVSIEIFEKALLMRGYPMSYHQRLSKAKLEMQLMIDEILQIDADTRTCSDIERGIRRYLKRMSNTAKTTEEEIKKLVDGLCGWFGLNP